MTLGALLDEIRDTYVSHLANVVAAQEPCYAEPALRLQDGSVALEGDLGLPYRIDIVRKADGSSIMVNSPSVIRFTASSLTSSWTPATRTFTTWYAAWNRN